MAYQCIKCGVKLTKENWGPSYKKYYKYICRKCATTYNRKYQRQHPNYEKPLEVVTLCKSCHWRLHSGALEEKFVELAKETEK